MEDSVAKDQSSASANRSASRLLRYPLRSSKKEKPPLVDTSNSSSASTTKRGKSCSSSVSKSVSVLDTSGKSKEKPSKPPRRLSVPSKPGKSSAFGTITPISEARSKRNASSDTPRSDVSKSSSARKKFSVLSSASYWLSQIKLSESAAKHNISLGFFKLAFEAGCEPLQRVGDELKSYVQRYDLSDLGDSVKQLFESYKMSGNSEQSEISSTCSQVLPIQGNQSSDNNVDSSMSVTVGDENLKSVPLDKNVHQEKKSNQESVRKMTRSSARKKVEISKPVSDVKGQKKPEKSTKRESSQDTNKKKNQGKKSAREGHMKSPSQEILKENKENMAVPEIEETTLMTAEA